MNEAMAKLEAILLALPGPLEVCYIQKKLGLSGEEVKANLGSLQEKYKQESSGMRLLIEGEMVSLVTASEFAPFIKDSIKEDIEEELTSAALETLAIIAYRGPLSRAEIEDLRGVNSIYIIRQLLLKGLIERIEKNDGGFLYKLSFDFKKFLGIEEERELPEYEKFEKNDSFQEQKQTTE